MLTRLQWCKIRRLMGKPRRYVTRRLTDGCLAAVNGSEAVYLLLWIVHCDSKKTRHQTLVYILAKH